MPLKAAFYTLGCKLNFAETATIASLLKQKGIEESKPEETPDICVVNTCSVTETADKKARHLVRHIHKRNPLATIVVTGCYAQLKPREAASLPGVGIVLGSNEKLRISQYIDSWLMNRQEIVSTSPGLEIKEFLPSCERGERTRFFLKIQDGCDYFCTYCTIPFARGRSRSGTVSSLVKMAKDAALAGGKEIVITGVNIGTFGLDNNQDFLTLLKALDKVEGIERYRISSIEPNLLTPEIIDWLATDAGKFMPHFHIPLQSGSDKVLRLMNRRYDTSLFKSRIDLIKESIPDAYIGVDIIAGARGENQEEWSKSLEFANSLDVAKFHVFPYSERPGTKALSLGDSVPTPERHRRVKILTELSDAKNRAFILKNVNSVRPVLWEKATGNNLMHGLTDNYIRIEAPLSKEFINNISDVVIKNLKQGSSDIAEAVHYSNSHS